MGAPHPVYSPDFCLFGYQKLQGAAIKKKDIIVQITIEKNALKIQTSLIFKHFQSNVL